MKIYDGGSLIIEDDKIIQKFGIDSPAVEKLIAYCHKKKFLFAILHMTRIVLRKAVMHLYLINFLNCI